MGLSRARSSPDKRFAAATASTRRTEAMRVRRSGLFSGAARMRAYRSGSVPSTSTAVSMKGQRSVENRLPFPASRFLR